MCGRYALHAHPDVIALQFALSTPPEFKPKYNIAPSRDSVYQQLTAVARPWRGKGLAEGVKAAMLDLIRALHLEVRTIIATNAEVNAPILSINQRLGFVVHRRDGTYQIGREMLARLVA